MEMKFREKDSHTLVASILKSLRDGNDKKICDGDLVVLNVKQIMGRKDYSHTQEEYRQFVESSRDKTFVVHSYHKRPDGFSALIELDGVEKWLFWCGDLIRVKDIQAEEGE
jgi:hypothetical protein